MINKLQGFMITFFLFSLAVFLFWISTTFSSLIFVDPALENEIVSISSSLIYNGEVEHGISALETLYASGRCHAPCLYLLSQNAIKKQQYAKSLLYCKQSLEQSYDHCQYLPTLQCIIQSYQHLNLTSKSISYLEEIYNCHALPINQSLSLFTHYLQHTNDLKHNTTKDLRNYLYYYLNLTSLATQTTIIQIDHDIECYFYTTLATSNNTIALPILQEIQSVRRKQLLKTITIDSSQWPPCLPVNEKVQKVEEEMVALHLQQQQQLQMIEARQAQQYAEEVIALGEAIIAYGTVVKKQQSQSNGSDSSSVTSAATSSSALVPPAIATAQHKAATASGTPLVASLSSSSSSSSLHNSREETEQKSDEASTKPAEEGEVTEENNTVDTSTTATTPIATSAAASAHTPSPMVAAAASVVGILSEPAALHAMEHEDEDSNHHQMMMHSSNVSELYKQHDNHLDHDHEPVTAVAASDVVPKPLYQTVSALLFSSPSSSSSSTSSSSESIRSDIETMQIGSKEFSTVTKIETKSTTAETETEVTKLVEEQSKHQLQNTETILTKEEVVVVHYQNDSRHHDDENHDNNSRQHSHSHNEETLLSSASPPPFLDSDTDDNNSNEDPSAEEEVSMTSASASSTFSNNTTTTNHTTDTAATINTTTTIPLSSKAPEAEAEAIKQQAKIAEQNRYAQPYLIMAMALYRQEDYTGCLKKINIALKKSPQYMDAYYLRGQVSLQLQDYPQVIKDYLYIIEDLQIKENSTVNGILLSLAQHYDSQQQQAGGSKSQEAYELYKRLLQTLPVEVLPYDLSLACTLSSLAMKLGQYEKAVSHLDALNITSSSSFIDKNNTVLSLYEKKLLLQRYIELYDEQHLHNVDKIITYMQMGSSLGIYAIEEIGEVYLQYNLTDKAISFYEQQLVEQNATTATITTTITVEEKLRRGNILRRLGDLHLQQLEEAQIAAAAVKQEAVMVDHHNSTIVEEGDSSIVVISNNHTVGLSSKEAWEYVRSLYDQAMELGVYDKHIRKFFAKYYAATGAPYHSHSSQGNHTIANTTPKPLQRSADDGFGDDDGSEHTASQPLSINTAHQQQSTIHRHHHRWVVNHIVEKPATEEIVEEQNSQPAAPQMKMGGSLRRESGDGGDLEHNLLSQLYSEAEGGDIEGGSADMNQFGGGGAFAEQYAMMEEEQERQAKAEALRNSRR